jgi:hypothetical protein
MSKRKAFVASMAIPSLMIGLTGSAQAAEDKTILDEAVQFTVDTAALGTGLSIGIPVSIMQSVPKSVDDIAQKIQTDLSDDRSATSYVVAAVPAIPLGTVYGAVAGIESGTKNALANYHDHPFGNKSLSLE